MRKLNILVIAVITAIVVGSVYFPLGPGDFGVHAIGLQIDGQNVARFFAHPTIGAEYSTPRDPNTITVCNFTTPLDTGSITQISIYLIGEPSGSNVRAVIYANDPDSQLPLNQQLLAQSIEDLNVTSMTGEWYNFTINFAASANTTYWFGYYSDHFTRYYYDVSADHISGTSANSTLPNYFPDSFTFTYGSSTIMSLSVVYTHADANPTLSPFQTSSPEIQVAQNSTGEVGLVIIFLAETTVAVFYYNYKKWRAGLSQK